MPYVSWNLKDLGNVKKNGYNVFSCFHCGGGSTMGYKLAGFNVLGGVEIDPNIMGVYRANHNPKHSYLMSVTDFVKIKDSDLPKELFDLDILDGSPPCSSFSMVGNREKNWGEKKKFREGQSEQVLDDLFFHFINIANKLKPKIVISENVTGLLKGYAKGYVKEIFEHFDKAGYETQLFQLNSANMGVPQRRERVFFISRRKDLNLPKIKLHFNESLIPFKDIDAGEVEIGKGFRGVSKRFWKLCNPGKYFSSVPEAKGSYFNSSRISSELPLPTIAASSQLYHYRFKRVLVDLEIIKGQSFPEDYNFLDQKVDYVCGMSVPPYMMQRIAEQIKLQLLDKIKLGDVDVERILESYNEESVTNEN
jgi:DNA (cytosine-5)-methyltransferase 1